MMNYELKIIYLLYRKPAWCLNCESAASENCTDTHCLVDMKPGSETNFAAILSLKNRYLQLRNPLCSRVAKVITEKKDVQIYLSQVLGALKTAQEEVEQMKDENDIIVAELMSLMESELLRECNSKEEEYLAFLAQLIPLLEDCEPDQESLETVHGKILQSFQVKKL